MKMSLKGLIATTALGMTVALPAMAETTIRLSTYVNEADIRYDGFVHFAELVAEKTGGSVTVEATKASQIGKKITSTPAIMHRCVSQRPAPRRSTMPVISRAISSAPVSRCI